MTIPININTPEAMNVPLDRPDIDPPLRKSTIVRINRHDSYDCSCENEREDQASVHD